jgi:predicted transposase YbfD/YdcC
MPKQYNEIEKSIDIQNFVKSVEDSFAEIKDPRAPDNQTYSLLHILIMILTASIAGADSITAIQEYGVLKFAMFKNILGITKSPSYSVFWWTLTRMEPKPLQKAFFEWVSKLPIEVQRKIIAIDGKHLNGLVGESKTHLVSAWESSAGLLLGQVKAEEKSNEITAIPELLDIIDIVGSVVTIDAAGCQTAITRKIREKGGDYTIALKGNQGTLHGEVENFFIQAEAVDFNEDTNCKTFTTLEKGHGRIEERCFVVCNNIDWLNSKDNWKDLKSVIQVTSKRAIGGKESKEKRYYISSLNQTPELAGQDIRSHWSVENHLHWSMDVIFNEDSSLANTFHCAENLAMFRRISQALIREEIGSKTGVAKSRRKAMWDDLYALKVLGQLMKINGKSF